MLYNCASNSQTEHYVSQFHSTVGRGFYRAICGLGVSCLGVGTYRGSCSDASDAEYHDAIVLAVLKGCNVIDTAINYRQQRSECTVGRALQSLMKRFGVPREAVVVATKGGFIPLNKEKGISIETEVGSIVQSGLASSDEIVDGIHCIAPKYIQHAIDISLKNLQLPCIDFYYLHNPEFQLSQMSHDRFSEQIRADFAVLERNVAQGKIRFYGIASWLGFRLPPDHQQYLSLQHLLNLACDVAGDKHHFRIIQVPLSLTMPDVAVVSNQKVFDSPETLLEAANALEIDVVCSAALGGGPDNAQNDEYTGNYIRKSLTFICNVPGITVGLIGMGKKKHVQHNLQIARNIAEVDIVELLKEVWLAKGFASFHEDKTFGTS